MARTQRTDLRERADALLDAAATLLIEVGSRELRIDEVARRAGVGKGTVYLHWRSREELLLAVGARAAVAMLDEVLAAIRADPVEAALHRYLRRHFLAAMRRPLLRSLFADPAHPGAHPARAGVLAAKLVAARAHLAALREHGLLRPGQDLADIDHAAQAIAYGFFAAGPLLPAGPRFTLEHRADQLADVIRRSFEPSTPPAPELFAAAAPQVLAAFAELRTEFHHLAYGP
ncbi:TetR/AcrR family transcriptional regulator [Nonomuraea sp. NPDC050310]|uniref:TetR/AcrR family transcriptional regulator n=1 Tax=Nonomuraea sp. NPDC050310 TaxID=3154935 RepID=UPI0033E1196D